VAKALKARLIVGSKGLAGMLRSIPVHGSLASGCSNRGHESREYPRSKRDDVRARLCPGQFFFFSIQTGLIDKGQARLGKT
jgi:hypothetical protein